MLDFFNSLWLEGLYKPIYNLVIFTYNLTPGPSFGLAVIGLAILIRFLFLYFTLLGYKHDEQLEEVKPFIEKIEGDKSLSSREKIAKVSTITKPFGINPFLVSLPLFAQIIFLGVLYQIIQGGIYTPGNHDLYSFVKFPGPLNTQFFGIDLAHVNFMLSSMAAVFLFLERVWEYNRRKKIAENFSQKWDPLIWPLSTFIILMVLPSAKAIFVMASVAFSFIITGIVRAARPKATRS
jgi:membrane protein insertase Oxa1/YidC/SpoIIIJ